MKKVIRKKKHHDLNRIKSMLKKIKGKLREEFGVKSIGIFGSVVRGESGEDSDIDILVEFEDNAEVSLLDFVRLEMFLSDLLGMDVDLVDKSALKPRIGKHILREVVYL